MTTTIRLILLCVLGFTLPGIRGISQGLSGKLFVHSDKSFYLAGEIIWFKIYEVDALYNRLLPLDKVAYIEVLDRKHNPILQAKITLEDGKGSGSFFIPRTVNTDNYSLRAYTNWMKNADPDTYFTKTITLFNPIKTIKIDQITNPVHYTAVIFPEGGHLVSGLQSHVAFKVSDQAGDGVEGKAFLLNSRLDTILWLGRCKRGIGSFFLTPAKDTPYQIAFTAGDTVIRVPVPPAQSEGFVMRMTDSADNRIKIIVHANTTFALPIYLLVGQPSAQPSAEPGTLIMESILKKGEAIFLVDKARLNSGFSQFTVLNSAKEPVCKRLYFIMPPSLEIQLNPASGSGAVFHGAREKLNFEILAQDRDGKPARAEMSASVYLIDSLQPLERTNILSYLWSGYGLEGNTDSPEVFFRDLEQSGSEHRNSFLHTQKSAKPRESPTFAFLPEYEGHVVRGKIADKNSDMPGQGIPVYLSVPGKIPRLARSVSNANGELFFLFRDFYGDDEVVAQVANARDSGYRIEIENGFSQEFSLRAIPPFQFSPALRDSYLSRGIAAQLQNIYFDETLQKFRPIPINDTMAFYGRPDRKYFLDDYTRFNSMEEVFKEYVKDVTVRRSRGHFQLRVFDPPNKAQFEDGPLVLVDGVPVSDMDSLIATDPLKFYKIEVVSGKYVLGDGRISGIVSLTTYTGDLASFPLDASALVFDYSGMQAKRIYYTPPYDQRQVSERLPDLRNVLDWRPDIKTDEHGKAQISFYTSDLKGTYALVIQGLTTDGLAGSRIFTFEVH